MLRGVQGSFRLGVGVRMSLRARYLWMVRPWWIRAVDAERRGALLGGCDSGIGGARLFDGGHLVVSCYCWCGN